MWALITNWLLNITIDAKVAKKWNENNDSFNNFILQNSHNLLIQTD